MRSIKINIVDDNDPFIDLKEKIITLMDDMSYYNRFNILGGGVDRKLHELYSELEIKRNIFVSFSGGESSAFLLLEVLKRYDSKYYNILVCFANTGDEHEETLRFVYDIQTYYDIEVAWLEAYVSPIKGIGVMPIVIDYKSASRDGKPLLDQSEKLGHCAITAAHCTRDLKVRIMHKHAKLVLGKNYTTMQGIRFDEQSRIKWGVAKLKNWDYPLARWRITKPMINEFWRKHKEYHGFRLNLKNHQGNCNLCFKKSDSKLVQQIRERPCLVIFRITLELISNNDLHDQYRANRSIFDLLDLAKSETKSNQLSIFGGECFC